MFEFLCSSAVAVNSKLQYAVVEVDSSSVDTSATSKDKEKRFGNLLKEGDKLYLIVALDLVPTLEAKWGRKLVVKATLTGAELENCRFLFLKQHSVKGCLQQLILDL